MSIIKIISDCRVSIHYRTATCRWKKTKKFWTVTHYERITRVTVFDEVEREKSHFSYFFEHQRAERLRSVVGISAVGWRAFANCLQGREWLMIDEQRQAVLQRDLLQCPAFLCDDTTSIHSYTRSAQRAAHLLVIMLSRDYNCDSTAIRLRSDYDVSRAQKMNMSIFRRSRVVVVS